MTPRVNVRRPKRRRGQQPRTGQTAPAQLHNTPGSLLLQGPHHLDFLVSPTPDLIITHTGINILWFTHIFRSVLRSVRPAAEPA